MKLFRLTDLRQNKKNKQEQENPNLPHKKFKYEIIQKLKNLATKSKLFFKNHFPKRIWAKPQEDRKGPRF